MRLYTKDEEAYIRLHYPTTDTKLIAEKLGRTAQSVNQKAHYMKVKKTPEFISNQSRNNNKGLFQKGNVAHNKGKKMPEELKARIAHTFFKKGHTAHNAKNVGDTSDHRDKYGRVYRLIKVSEDHWELYQRKIWMDNIGEIPNDMLVAFKDGNTLSFELSNLHLITRKENMLNNTIHRYPAELKYVMKLRKKLIKKINENGKK